MIETGREKGTTVDMDAWEGGRRNSPIPDILHCGKNSEQTLVADALTQMLVGWVIRETPELVLYRLGEMRTLDD
jgi:hypothetical protein